MHDGGVAAAQPAAAMLIGDRGIYTLTRVALLLGMLGLLPGAAAGAVREEIVAYGHAGSQLEGAIYYDDAVTGRRPGVLVIHEWWGLNPYAKDRARQLAALGYVAFAVDMYGKGKLTEHPSEAGEWAAAVTANIEQWRGRAVLGHTLLKQHRLVDPARTAAIGYCFGGASVLQLAYSGADVRGVVSFHGSLPAPTPGANFKASIMVQHGAADPFVKPEQITAFQSSLNAAGADWQMTVYAHARHSFTDPEAGRHGMDALAYDAVADRRSWRAMQGFLVELFGP